MQSLPRASSDDQVEQIDFVADQWMSAADSWKSLTSVLSTAWDSVNNWLNQDMQLCVLKNWSAAITAGCILIPEPVEFLICATLAMAASIMLCN